MARPRKTELAYFPQWNPQYVTRQKLNNSSFSARYKILRNSSSNFIKRLDVRQAILEKCLHKCIKCGSEENLQVDHIVSVYVCAHGEFPINNLNTYDNLQILCVKCNSAKKPKKR